MPQEIESYVSLKVLLNQIFFEVIQLILHNIFAILNEDVSQVHQE